METVQFAGWIGQDYQKRLSELKLFVTLKARRGGKTENVKGLDFHITKYL
jgi:hypothetical protein